MKYQWEPWQQFREEFCYTLETNDILAANIEGIRMLIEHYLAPRKRFMTKDDFISLVTRDSNVKIGEKEAIYCYGMSKMTVVKESVTPKKYFQIDQAELCEMICRVTEYKFKTMT